MIHATPKHLLIRTDASAHIGIGHLMRCLAIAQAAGDAGHRVTLATHGALPDPLAALWRNESIDIVPIIANPGSADDAKEAWQIACQYGATTVLIDGYHFGPDFWNAMRAFFTPSPLVGEGRGEGEVFHTAALHDLPNDPLPTVDIIINPNPGVSPAEYQNFPGTLYCGSDYTPLQRHVAAQAQQARASNSRTLFASFGGSDATHLSEWLCTQLDALRATDIAVHLVCGPTNPRRPLLEYFFRDDPLHRLLIAPTPQQFARHAHAARAAFVAAGSTCWELAALGIPQWAIVTAQNQQIVAQGLAVHHWGRSSLRHALPTTQALIDWCNTAAPPAAPLPTGGAAQCMRALLPISP